MMTFWVAAGCTIVAFYLGNCHGHARERWQNQLRRMRNADPAISDNDNLKESQ